MGLVDSIIKSALTGGSAQPSRPQQPTQSRPSPASGGNLMQVIKSIASNAVANQRQQQGQAAGGGGWNPATNSEYKINGPSSNTSGSFGGSEEKSKGKEDEVLSQSSTTNGKKRNKSWWHNNLDQALGTEGVGGFVNDVLSYSAPVAIADTFSPEWAQNPLSQKEAAEQTYGGNGPMEFSGEYGMPSADQLQQLTPEQQQEWLEDTLGGLGSTAAVAMSAGGQIANIGRSGAKALDPVLGLAKKNKGSSKAQRRAYAEAKAGKAAPEATPEAATTAGNFEQAAENAVDPLFTGVPKSNPTGVKFDPTKFRTTESLLAERDAKRAARKAAKEAAEPKAAAAAEPEVAAVGKFEQAAENASIPRNLNRALLRDSKNRLELNPVENSFDVIPRELVDVSEADAKILKEAFGEKQADRILNGLGESATKPREPNLSEANMRAIDKNQRNVDEGLEKALNDSMEEGKKLLKEADAKKIGPKKALASGLLGLGLFSTATNKQVVDTFGNAANNVNDFLNSIAGVDAEGNRITEDSEENPADNQDKGGGIAHLMIDPYTGQPVWGLSREDWNKKEQRDQYAQALTDENFRNWISGFNPQYADDANGYEYFRDLDLGDKEEMLYNMLGYNGGQYELPGWRDMYSTAIYNATNGKERLTGDAEHDMPLIMDWIDDSAIDAGLAVDPTEKGMAYLPTVNLGIGYGSARNMSDYLIQKDAGDFYEGIRQATGNDYPYDNADLGTALFYENMKNNADKTDFSKYGQDNLDQLAALLNMGGDTAQFEFYEPAEGEEDSWRPNADYSYYNLANAAGTLKPEELAQYLPVYDDLKYVDNAIPADAADTILSDYSKWTGQHIRRKNSGKKNE